MNKMITMLTMKIQHKVWQMVKDRSPSMERKVVSGQLGRKRFAGRRMVYPPEFEKWMIKYIDSRKPFMVARLGAVELMLLRTFDFQNTAHYGKVLHQAHECAGFFPETESAAKRFGCIYKEALQTCDGMGIWRAEGEAYYIRKWTARELTCFSIEYLASWLSDMPWTQALQGKRVLVIHPFAESIKKQYEEKRTKIFEDQRVLPQFECIVYRAIQSNAGADADGYASWFEALEVMKKDISNIDFDIALIACGAYGFPLAAYIKKIGKQAVHMGGILQMQFGIKGNRWLNDPEYNRFFNDSWVFPSDSETPRLAENVEHAAYWGK